MWNTEDIELLQSELAPAVYRRIFLYSTWLLYLWIRFTCFLTFHFIFWVFWSKLSM